jgi:hypothetical protein
LGQNGAPQVVGVDGACDHPVSEVGATHSANAANHGDDREILIE